MYLPRIIISVVFTMTRVKYKKTKTRIIEELLSKIPPLSWLLRYVLKTQYHSPERNTNELQNGIYWDRRIRWELPDWTLDRYVLIWCQYLSRSSKASFVCPKSSSTLDMAREAAMSRSFFFFISSSRSWSFLFCISFLAASLKNIQCNLRFFNIADLSRLKTKISHCQLTLP